jgi:hypothetical protein
MDAVTLVFNSAFHAGLILTLLLRNLAVAAAMHDAGADRGPQQRIYVLSLCASF